MDTEQQFKSGEIEFLTAVLALEADGLSPTEAEDQVLLWEKEMSEDNSQFGVGA